MADAVVDATLAPLSSAAAGTVAVSGAASQTLGAATTAAAAKVTVAAALAKTLAALSSSTSLAVRFRRPTAIPPVPESVEHRSWPSWLTMLARTLNLVLAGKMNAVAAVTLAAGDTTTTLTDQRIGKASHLSLTPLTASAAAAAVAGIYIEPGAGSAVINHASDPAADQQFSVLIIG